MINRKIAALQSMAIIGALHGISSCERPKLHTEITVHPKPELETEAEKAQRRGLKQWEFEGEIVYAATRKKAFKLFQEKLK